MNPQHWTPATEACVGTLLSAGCAAMHGLEVITPIAEGVGALCGAVIGLHGIYRLMRPRPRSKRTRWSDNRNDGDEL
jgi:hypothetical protein